MTVIYRYGLIERLSYRKLIIFLAGISLFTSVVLRVIAVQPLTSDAMIRGPFSDDGYYYLQIARNFVEKGIFTFDGINRTNGFHPLWQIMLVFIAQLSTQNFVFMRLVLYFGILLFALTGVLLFYFVYNHGGYIAGATALMLWSFSPGLIIWQNQAMENTVFLPLLILALIQIDRYIQHPDRIRGAMLTGIILGLLMWSRSDSLLFVILSLIGIEIYFWMKSKAIMVSQVRSLLVVLGITFIFGVGYLLFNYYAAGAYFSVSGATKIFEGANNTWQLPQIVSALKLHSSMVSNIFTSIGGLSWWGFNWRIYPFKFFMLIWVVVAIGWWGFNFMNKNRKKKPGLLHGNRIGLKLLILYTLMHTIFLVTLLRNQLEWTTWYIVPQILTGLIVIPLFLFPERMVYDLSNGLIVKIHGFLNRTDGFQNLGNYLWIGYSLGVGLTLLVVLGACIWTMTVPIKSWLDNNTDPKSMDARYELALWLNEHVSPNSRIGMFDAGLTGYFSDAHVINLDGLVNSPEYYKSTRRSNDYANYIIDNQIEYMIMYFFPPYKMNLRPPRDDTNVCHKLEYITNNASGWGPGDLVKNYYEVVALKYDGACKGDWKSGFPTNSVPPS